MKIVMETLEECKSAESVILDHESRKNKNKKIDYIVSELREAVNVFHIKNIDRIGPVTCKFCGKKWMAICFNSSKSLSCPSCNKHNKLPETINKEKE